MQPIIRMALENEAELISDLVNMAYRYPHPLSWTNESAWIAGERTSVEAVKALMAKDSCLLVALIDNNIMACLHMGISGDTAHLGMLTVHPALQNQGVGKILLEYAEQYASHQLRLKLVEMVVLVERKELMAFYLRRGYVRTGNISPYPSTGFGKPRVAGLQIEVLQKIIN